MKQEHTLKMFDGNTSCKKMHCIVDGDEFVL